MNITGEPASQLTQTRIATDPRSQYNNDNQITCNLNAKPNTIVLSIPNSDSDKSEIASHVPNCILKLEQPDAVSNDTHKYSKITNSRRNKIEIKPVLLSTEPNMPDNSLVKHTPSTTSQPPIDFSSTTDIRPIKQPIS